MSIVNRPAAHPGLFQTMTVSSRLRSRFIFIGWIEEDDDSSLTSVAGGWCRQTGGLGNHRVAIELQLEMHDLVFTPAPYLPTIIMLKSLKIKSG